jgi:hypothetical protein
MLAGFLYLLAANFVQRHAAIEAHHLNIAYECMCFGVYKVGNYNRSYMMTPYSRKTIILVHVLVVSSHLDSPWQSVLTRQENNYKRNLEWDWTAKDGTAKVGRLLFPLKKGYRPQQVALFLF